MGPSQSRLREIAIESSEKLHKAKVSGTFSNEPFKHIYVDNFFPKDFAMKLLEAFPIECDSSWEEANDPDIEVKLRSKWESEFDVPENILPAIRILNSAIFLKALSSIMDIPKIIPDPYFTGGGLNLTRKGGLLDVHVDGNYHDATGLNRRLNAILYLNPDWDDSWGGEFGLYDSSGENLLKKVAPIFNRLVVFDSHDKSYHGLPDPVNFPKDKPRRSIILYYYTKDSRPDEQILVEKPHSALWKKRNFLDKRGKKTRDFS